MDALDRFFSRLYELDIFTHNHLNRCQYDLDVYRKGKDFTSEELKLLVNAAYFALLDDFNRFHGAFSDQLHSDPPANSAPNLKDLLPTEEEEDWSDIPF